MQGVPPCTPRRSKKLMWLRRKERERNQAPILGGGDLPARANTTAWGLMERHGLRYPCKGQVVTCPSALAASVKVFAGCRGLFSKSRPAGEPSADGGAKPYSLSSLQGQVSISQKWYNLLHHSSNGIYSSPL